MSNLDSILSNFPIASESKTRDQPPLHISRPPQPFPMDSDGDDVPPPPRGILRPFDDMRASGISTSPERRMLEKSPKKHAMHTSPRSERDDFGIERPISPSPRSASKQASRSDCIEISSSEDEVPRKPTKSVPSPRLNMGKPLQMSRERMRLKALANSKALAKARDKRQTPNMDSDFIDLT